MTIPDGRPLGNDGNDVTLPLDDGEIYVRQDGPRDAPALLLVHGNASSTRSWEELVPILIRSHRVIRIDLLGHGRSAKPEDRSYALPDQARRVGMALDRLGVERVIVAGHSSGGGTVTPLAEQRADLVAAPVLINTLSASRSWSRVRARPSAPGRSGRRSPEAALSDFRRLERASAAAGSGCQRRRCGGVWMSK